MDRAAVSRPKIALALPEGSPLGAIREAGALGAAATTAKTDPPGDGSDPSWLMQAPGEPGHALQGLAQQERRAW